MTKGHLKVGKQGTELNRIKYQLQIMVQYFIRLSQNLAYDTSNDCDFAKYSKKESVQTEIV